MTTPILIFDPAAELRITNARYEEWRLHAADGGIIIWNRAGAVGIVGNAVLVNVLECCQRDRILLGTGNMWPDMVQSITWDQVTIAKDDRPRPVTV